MIQQLRKVALFLALPLSGALAFFLLIYFGFLSIGPRKPAPKANIAIVNLVEIDNRALIYQNLNKLLEEKVGKLKKEFSSQEAAVLKEQEGIRLLRKEGKTADEQLHKMKDDLNNRIQEIEKSIVAQKDELDAVFRKHSEDISERIRKIIDKIRLEEGYDLILTAGLHDKGDNFPLVLSAGPHIDITDKVIEALNKEISQVDKE